MSGPTIDRANSSGDIWTPWEFIGAVTQKFGPIAFDLAASLLSCKAAFGGMYYDEAADSLTKEWHKIDGLLWLNPPYSHITPWAIKCKAEMALGAEILLLVPASIGARWFEYHVWPHADVYSVGRMVFDNCYNKRGELVTTPYPKDLVLCHYSWRNETLRTGERLLFWNWKEAK